MSQDRARRLATGACWPIYMGSRRVTNTPQVANLPHKFCRIPVGGKTKWHWAILPAAAFQAAGRLKAGCSQD